MDDAQHHIALGRHRLETAPLRAADEFRKAIQTEPKNVEAHALLAMALGAGGKPRDALHAADRALELAPDDAFNYLVRGEILGRLNRWRDAKTMFLQAVARSPDEAQAHALLADCLGALNELVPAENAARRAIELDPDDERGHLMLGLILLERERNEEALSSLEMALQLNPEMAGAHAALGAWQLRQGRAAQSLGAMLEAMRLDPNDRTTQHNLALAQSGGAWWAAPYWSFIALTGKWPPPLRRLARSGFFWLVATWMLAGWMENESLTGSAARFAGVGAYALFAFVLVFASYCVLVSIALDVRTRRVTGTLEIIEPPRSPLTRKSRLLQSLFGVASLFATTVIAALLYDWSPLLSLLFFAGALLGLCCWSARRKKDEDSEA